MMEWVKKLFRRNSRTERVELRLARYCEADRLLAEGWQLAPEEDGYVYLEKRHAPCEHEWVNVLDVCKGKPCYGQVLGRKCARCGLFDGSRVNRTGETPTTPQDPQRSHMTDTLDLRCLVQALSRLMNAEREEMTERESYVGCSWDYHGQSYIQAREDAATEFGKRLDEYIDARVQSALSRR